MKKQKIGKISSKQRKSKYADVATKKNKTKVKTKMPSQKAVKVAKLDKDETVHNMSKTEFENYIGRILIANGFLPIGKIEATLQHIWDEDTTVFYNVEQHMENCILDPKTINTTYQ